MTASPDSLSDPNGIRILRTHIQVEPHHRVNRAPGLPPAQSGKNIERNREIASDAAIMAKVVVVCWQEIPSLVEVREGASVSKQQLSARFQELIDVVAMRKKLTGSDAYLEQWNRRRERERAGNVKDVAAAVAAEIESRFDDIRAAAIAQIKDA